MFEIGKRPKFLEEAFYEKLQEYLIATLITLLIFCLANFWLKWICFYIGTTLILSGIIANLISYFKPRRRIDGKGKAIFITGCGSGFGKMLAQRLDDLGFYVFAGCHHPEGDGAISLKQYASNRLHIVPLDVTSEESVTKAVDYITANLNSNKFWALINNAGFIEFGEIFWQSFDSINCMLETNTIGVVRVTKAFLPLICSSKGRIITVSSAAGRSPFVPTNISYAMSKYAITSFMDGLRLEMYKFDVRVITIEPFAYRTKFLDENFILNTMHKSWQAAPQEIKSFYPKYYWNWIDETMRNNLKFLVNGKPEEVIRCLEEAILSINPKLSYMPGYKILRFGVWISEWIPRVFTHWITEVFIDNSNNIYRMIS